jgi:pimeloyl-ACP methyl ester carboxylesterase
MRQESKIIAGVNVTLSWPNDDGDDSKVRGVTFLLPGSLVSISEYNGLRDVLLELNHLVVSFFINVFWPLFDNHQTHARNAQRVFEGLVGQHKKLPETYSVVGHSVGGKIALLLTSVIDPTRVNAVIALDPVDINPVQFTNNKGNNLTLNGDTGIPIMLTCTDGGWGIPENHNAEAIHKLNRNSTRFHRDEHAGHMAYCDHGGGLAGKVIPDVGTKEGNANARMAAQKLIREILK